MYYILNQSYLNHVFLYTLLMILSYINKRYDWDFIKVKFVDEDIILKYALLTLLIWFSLILNHRYIFHYAMRVILAGCSSILFGNTQTPDHGIDNKSCHFPILFEHLLTSIRKSGAIVSNLHQKVYVYRT